MTQFVHKEKEEEEITEVVHLSACERAMFHTRFYFYFLESGQCCVSLHEEMMLSFENIEGIVAFL